MLSSQDARATSMRRELPISHENVLAGPKETNSHMFAVGVQTARIKPVLLLHLVELKPTLSTEEKSELLPHFNLGEGFYRRR